jgi:hypothetical protein
MKFEVHNKQETVSIDDAFWNRAFTFASRELQIEHHHAMVACVFIPLDLERTVKFKAFSLGATGLSEDGAWFYVVAAKSLTDGRMVKTFFHELTHVKQLLMGQLINKHRHIVWKEEGKKEEKWDKREYSFAPWETEANAFSDKAYEAFLRREVTRAMADKNVHAYHPAILQLQCMFVQDDVFRLTQELHRERGQLGSASAEKNTAGEN